MSNETVANKPECASEPRTMVIPEFLLKHVHYEVNESLHERAQRIQEIGANLLKDGDEAALEVGVLLPFTDVYDLTGQRIDPINARNIARSIDSYRSRTPVDNGTEPWTEVSNNLDQVRRLSEFWSTETEEFQRKPNLLHPSSLQRGPIVDAAIVKDFLVNNNITKEAILARSLYLLERLTSYRDEMEASGHAVKNADEVLALVDETDAIYVQLCDVIAYYQLSAALYDKVVQVKYYLADRHSDIRLLREKYNSYLSHNGGIAEIMQQVHSACLGIDCALNPAITHSDAHDTYYWLSGIVDTASTHHDYDESHDRARATTTKVRGRLKSFGAYLEKAMPLMGSLDDNTEVMDVFGFSVIPATDEDIPQLYCDLIDTLNALKREGRLEFQASPSRTEALHVKGPQVFIDACTDANRLSHSGRKAIERHLIDSRPSSRGYVVAKATFLLTIPDDSSQNTDPIPTEIQTVSSETRDGVRTGPHSHWVHKLEKYKKYKFSPEELKKVVEALGAIKTHLEKRAGT